MTNYLSSRHFPSVTAEQAQALSANLTAILDSHEATDFYRLFADYQTILADNQQHANWPEIHEKLQTLFKCGKAAPLDGPMIGIPLAIRDSDYFKETVQLFGQQRSIIASIEWMATAWNTTFANTGLWMGKTYEPVSQQTIAELVGHSADAITAYSSETTRMGRNFFRPPPDPNAIQGLGLPALSKLWQLRDRPKSTHAQGFNTRLLQDNLDKENVIPYSKTGGLFIADLGLSVVPEMRGKPVYQLNYRWENLHPAYPMTSLIDEVVQIAEGIYLGQLVFARKNYSLGSINLPFLAEKLSMSLGEPYTSPHKKASFWPALMEKLTGKAHDDLLDYGYQNNGFFLMMDPVYAHKVYADNAFPQLRPRPGEQGFIELGYHEQTKTARSAVGNHTLDWLNGWQTHHQLKNKFTTFILEPSPKTDDPSDVTSMRQENESILQMLKRISEDISNQTKYQDHLQHFEKLHQLFRQGVAPSVQQGLFQGHGKKTYNTRANSPTKRDWYGEKETTSGFDYYHGATLNLHWGFRDSYMPDIKNKLDDYLIFPSSLATLLPNESLSGPNIMDITWRSIGKYIFPWAGKSFEKISGRKLSMLLDESDDLAQRYPGRVKQLKNYLASAPHYDLVKKNSQHYWPQQGLYANHLKHGAWDHGMPTDDKDFWQQQANDHWVFGTNLQDNRVLTMDAIMRIADMNYRIPDVSLQALSRQGPSPFARQGYIFLGAAHQSSILPINNGEQNKKQVFQFHYRYPMLGGAIPISYCLDELVEIADGLFLGQLIYSTALHEPFHSSVDPAKYKYQLFGYFLLLDDDWEQHRQAIGLDVWRKQSAAKPKEDGLHLVN